MIKKQIRNEERNVEKPSFKYRKKIRTALHGLFFDAAFLRFCIIASMITAPLAILISAVIASTTNGYSMTINYISDLGSIFYDPYPWMLDYSAMLTAFFLGPPIFLFESKLVSYPLTPSPDPSDPLVFPSRLRLHLGSFMSFSFLLGLAGLFGIGLFSEDRNVMNLHGYSTVLVFGGMGLGYIFAGIIILCCKTSFSKILGAYILIAPSTFVMLNFVLQDPIYEWGAFFTIAGGMVPIFSNLLRGLSRQQTH